tara:strand:+ start:1058 stop:1417 length:360 start_codon:yes stop_codon:yes gene_type:complete
MDIEPRLTIRTLEELLAGSYVGCRYETTFESIEVLGDVEKPSLEVFKTKYDDLKNRVVPLEELRLERSYKLTNSDWTVGNDSPLSPEKIQEWRTYRQALRDLPSVTEDPKTPIWPVPPQ